MDVMIPVGISAGAITVLARVSESKSKIAPKHMENGSRVFALGPAIFLAI